MELGLAKLGAPVMVRRWQGAAGRAEPLGTGLVEVTVHVISRARELSCVPAASADKEGKSKGAEYASDTTNGDANEGSAGQATQ